jgi:hypothetical protein
VGFGEPRFNERGDLVTVGATSSGSGPPVRGIFSAPAGGPFASLVRHGDPAPGAPDGLVFSFFSTPRIDDAGRVAFGSTLSWGSLGPVDGIWGADGEPGVSPYLVGGDPAPGLPPGVEVTHVHLVAMNREGDLLLTAGLDGPGVDYENDLALYYARDPTHRIPVIAEGWPLEVGPDDLRTVAGLDLSLDRLGSSPFATERRIAFQAWFTDGSSGVFVAEAPACADLVTAIDVKPHRERNRLDPRRRGGVRVAAFGSEHLDATGIDAETLAFGPGGAAARRRSLRYRDVNHDGYIDLVARFRVREAGLAPGDDEACLSGVTVDGVSFIGCDAIDSRPPRQGEEIPRSGSSHTASYARCF